MGSIGPNADTSAISRFNRSSLISVEPKMKIEAMIEINEAVSTDLFRVLQFKSQFPSDSFLLTR